MKNGSSKALEWISKKGIAGYEPFSGIEPWYLMPKKDIFDAKERWPNGTSTKSLITFARRQDSDDIACFEGAESDTAEIVIIHGWTEEGYVIVNRCENIWAWMKSVVDDIADWSSFEEPN